MPAPPGDVMAGCVSVSDALTWSKGRGLAEILDLLMALEANTFDLYLKLARQVTSGQAKKVFSALAEEQSRQLDSLAAVFEKNL